MFGVSYNRLLHQNKKNHKSNLSCSYEARKKLTVGESSDSAAHIIEKHATTVKYVREQTKVKP